MSDPSYFYRKRQRERANAVALELTARTVSAAAANGTEIGAFNVRNGSGNYTFTLTDDAGGKFDVSGVKLRKADALTEGLINVEVEADNTVDTPLTGVFQIRVTA